MRFTTTLSLLALAAASTALPQGLNQPIFNCSVPSIGGCCEKFLDAGFGVGCKKAGIIIEGAYEQFICNNVATDIGLPACCQVIETPPGTRIGIPMPCQNISAGY